jgi:hypothetical protein
MGGLLEVVALGGGKFSVDRLLGRLLDRRVVPTAYTLHPAE